MTQARSAVFRVNAEGFKKFSQPNWEVRFHLPIYDKRFGGLTYTGVTKLDVTSSEFQAETLANLAERGNILCRRATDLVEL